MSLTSLLNNKDVRKKFRQEFRKPPFILQDEMLAPPVTKNYTLVGVAFDYLLRFYLQHLNSNLAKTETLIAEHTLDLLDKDQSLYSIGQVIIEGAKESLHIYLETGQMTRELMESALLLATLDPIFRSGFGHEFIGDINVGDIRDLENLLSIVDPEVFKAQKLCLLNPTFGDASTLVGGADADLVIDDTLIDIKTTISGKVPRDDFNQIVGYYILHEIGGIGEIEPKTKITKLGIYFSRHSYLHTYDLNSIINWKTFPVFLGWFQNRAKQETEEILDEILMLKTKIAPIQAKRKFKKNRKRAKKRSPSPRVELIVRDFVAGIKDRGFKPGKSRINPYHHPDIPGIRVVIAKRVIRIERKGPKNNYIRWNLSRSFSILTEIPLALEAIDILLKESEE